MERAAILTVSVPSGGVFIRQRFARPLILMIMGHLARATADRCGIVTTVAVVAMLSLIACRLFDPLDGGRRVLMVAAGFAHDESLLNGSRPYGILNTSTV
ncbi:hypothetical protein G113_10949 [Aeromonas molluscorum 848]|uniref:Uncharacterized protein n=1 Tax=Aeromonas molluscorum 848 TaxID=1268236 RepID=R1H380_9GAMM|nr:hypothetical protein G113_10949 [Aeromonas molluscorum 848]